VLILGGEGMLGHKVYQVLSQRFETFATFRDIDGVWRHFPMYQNNPATIGGVDAMDFNSIIHTLYDIKPDVVINCIGIIKHLKEAKDAIISITLNALFPNRLAELCQLAGIRMFHMSTDCVFTGRKGNYTEEDIPDAEDLYGRSKFLGEVDKPGCLTIRTSIFGRDFLKQIAFLEWFLSNDGGSVRGYTNAIYTGFPTQILAKMIGDLINDYPDLSGLYQISSEPISKYNLLVKIRDRMNLDIEIERFQDEPCDLSLNSSKFRNETGYRIPDWDEMIEELANDSTPYDEWREKYVTS